MTRALGVVALATMLLASAPADAEVTAREAAGYRPATIHEINSILQDLGDLQVELNRAEAMVHPLMCETSKPWSPTEVAQMVHCATRRFGGDANHIIAMGACESGLQWNETGNPPYEGVFQYHPGTWASAAGRYWFPAWGRRHVQIPSIFNARAQVIVTVRYVKAGGYGPWTCG